MDHTESTAAEALARRLVDHGVTTVFGLPGEENLTFVEALCATDIELVVTRHEQHAAFMAATHGRLTGRPGVCFATLGPGATNLFTGLAHAELGGWPLIAITGQKPRRDNDEGSFQVLDIPAAARPLTRWATSVDDPRTIVATLDEAFSRALAGRPGAVLIELPEDVAGEPTGALAGPAAAPATSVEASPAPASLVAAAAAIDAAERVVVIAAGGSSNPGVSAALTHFAAATGIGVIATQTGKGTIAESHPLSYRSLGIHRPDYAHLALDADLVITVGYQPVEHPPLAWNPDGATPIVHVAPWPAAIERGYQPRHQVVGAISTSLEALADAVRPRDPEAGAELRSTIVGLLDAEDEGGAFPPSPLSVVRTTRRLLAPDDVVALDNGVYKIWFARHYTTERPNTVLLDNALATMGAGLAIGTEAARLHPDRRVVAVCGDGGFLMNVQDLETACRLGVDLTVLVLRDDAYGFIGWHQEEQGRRRQGVALGNPDLTALARAFGAGAHAVTPDSPLEQVLADALDEPGVSLVDCPIDYSINDRLEADLLGEARQAQAQEPQ